MVLVTIRVQEDNGGGPFYTEPTYHGLVLVEINLEGNETFLNGKTDIGIRIGNSLQLFTPDSEVIVIIHQDQFLFLPCLCLGRRERYLPLNRFCHIDALLCLNLELIRACHLTFFYDLSYLSSHDCPING